MLRTPTEFFSLLFHRELRNELREIIFQQYVIKCEIKLTMDVK